VPRHVCKLCRTPVHDPEEHVRREHILLSFSEDRDGLFEVVEGAESEGA
jgi:hypothetical protein